MTEPAPRDGPSRRRPTRTARAVQRSVYLIAPLRLAYLYMPLGANPGST